jgi:hypothetical protein
MRWPLAGQPGGDCSFGGGWACGHAWWQVDRRRASTRKGAVAERCQGFLGSVGAERLGAGAAFERELIMGYWEVVPHVGIGPVRLGVAPDEFVDKHGFEKTEEDDDGADIWAWYENADGEVFFQTCNAIIVAVNTDGACLYRGTQLHGLDLEQVRSLFAEDDVIEEEGDVGLQFEVEALELELILWEGRVGTVGVSVDPDDVL